MPINHIVKAGDCISSIAFAHGFFPDTIWNESANAGLKQQRQSPNVLLAGDLVTIPDKREKEEGIAWEKRHQFRRKGVPEVLRLKLLDDSGQPRKGLKFKLIIDDVEHEGTTDSSGKLKQYIPPDAQKAVLLIDPHERYELNLGHLEPVETETGIRARLVNLGFLARADVPSSEYLAALHRFQQTYSLPEASEADEATRKKLKETHGS